MGLTTPDGTLDLLAIEWLEQELPAYNLTVGQTHTYSVGEQMVWVHNSCVYKVPGERTDSGKDYVGMTTKDNPSLRPGNGKDGRYRESGDTVIDMGDVRGKDLNIQEQIIMNQNGGKKTLIIKPTQSKKLIGKNMVSRRQKNDE